MHKSLLEILQCSHCRGQLQPASAQLICAQCGAGFPIRDGAAIFVSGPIAHAPADHRSNPLGEQFEQVLCEGKDLVLHIGAGASKTRYPNCVEFERKIFPHTDVVGDAHSLPFRDNSFDRVFAFNVFEHLRDPKTAAREIHRVLKPGGSIAIHTAFLQSLHEEPAHFYNATEYGVREWFAPFEIERCEVSGNFSPGYMLAFLMANTLEALRAAGVSESDQSALRQTTIGEWATFWGRNENPPAAFDVLHRLPQQFQKRIAAGFELIAKKPAS
jgi:SAM-dependent methyltransferase